MDEPTAPEPTSASGTAIESRRGESARIRALRPSKNPVDPFVPHGHLWEEERAHDGGARRVLTIFLTGAECPFTCLFCDLWRGTLDGPTPEGAIPAQIDYVLEQGSPPPVGAALKLYNASNFFDARAVPPADHARICDLAAPFARVTVECHPRLISPRRGTLPLGAELCIRFADRLDGDLEVAMGLETVHPGVFPRLNKGMEIADFDRAVNFLHAHRIGVRAFVLLGLPFLSAHEGRAWAVRSARHAFEAGADRVSLIPLRPGNGALGLLGAGGELDRVRLEDLEKTLEDALMEATALGGGIVEADLWDAGALSDCDSCADARIRRLAAMNATGTVLPRTSCADCGR